MFQGQVERTLGVDDILESLIALVFFGHVWVVRNIIRVLVIIFGLICCNFSHI